VGGGFETGLQNRVPLELSYAVRTGIHLRPGHETEDTLLDLKALGTEFVVIHGPKSREYYRDFARPERISASLPAVYRIEDDTIYALPSRPLAHLVRPEELAGGLAPYVTAIEDPSRPVLSARWPDSNTIAIAGPVPEGDRISVQVNADPGWRATQDGHSIPITQDGIGFLVLHPAPSTATQIELQYHGTVEQRIMAGISAVSWLVALFTLLWRRDSSRRFSSPGNAKM
jgi:hypothetical protein